MMRVHVHGSRGLPGRAFLLLVIFAYLAVSIAAPSAIAQSAAVPGWKPWIDPKVPLARREAARALFLEGTRLIREGFFGEAEAKYQEALLLFAHPGIYYNLGIAQLNQKKLVLAYQSFERAIEHGDGPLGEDRYQQARSYLALLDGQLVKLEIVCSLVGSEVSLDRATVLRGPGTYRAMVLAGEHRIVASKPGFLTDTRKVTLGAGKEVRLEVAPRPFVEVRTVRRQAWWKPWVVTGAGSAVLLAGAVLRWRAGTNVDAYDDRFAAACPRGCQDSDVDEDLSVRLDRGRWFQRSAVAATLVGAATLSVGVVLVYQNQPHVVGAAEADKLALTPMISPDQVGVSAAFSF